MAQEQHSHGIPANSEGVFVCGDSEETKAQTIPNFPKVGNAVGNKNQRFLTCADVAVKLGVTKRTVNNWCETGYLLATAKPYGRKIQYQITPEAVELLLFKVKENNQQVPRALKQEQKIQPSHAEFIDSWVHAMAEGLLTGKPFSKSTIYDYEKGHIRPFIEKYGTINIDNFVKALTKIPIERFSSRDHLYKAVLCFGKYLIKQGVLGEEFIAKLKELRPKRHLPPKRLVVEAGDLDKLLLACETPLDKLILVLLSSTGLRASEACALKMDDIDLDRQILTVKVGKGGKPRKTGLAMACMQVIREYLESEGVKVSKNRYLLQDRDGNQMCRNGLYQRLERVGNRAKVKVSPHALRRAFVTINANKGRPLQMLQIACGHSSIKTTMDYCRTSEQEVIEAMKGWD